MELNLVNLQQHNDMIKLYIVYHFGPITIPSVLHLSTNMYSLLYIPVSKLSRVLWN